MTASVAGAEIDPQQYRQLFLEYGAVGAMSGLRRVLHQPVNLGPVVFPDRARGELAVQSSRVPQWNPDKSLWEWWYKGFTTCTDEYLSLYATSVDGVHWDTADVGLYEWNGSMSNNVALRPTDRRNRCQPHRPIAAAARYTG